MQNPNHERSETANAASVIQQELQGALGEPDKRQRKLIANLDRLRRSLLGPEDLLDRTSYSRPFPPHRHQRKSGADPDWTQETITIDIPQG
jgi:hypothetical protein